jgi:hypothetical protein
MILSSTSTSIPRSNSYSCGTCSGDPHVNTFVVFTHRCTLQLHFTGVASAVLPRAVPNRKTLRESPIESRTSIDGNQPISQFQPVARVSYATCPNTTGQIGAKKGEQRLLQTKFRRCSRSVRLLIASAGLRRISSNNTAITPQVCRLSGAYRTPLAAHASAFPVFAFLFFFLQTITPQSIMSSVSPCSQPKIVAEREADGWYMPRHIQSVHS